MPHYTTDHPDTAAATVRQTATSNTLEITLEHIAKQSPAILTRKEVERVTGGAVNARTLANRDSNRTGITPRLRVGGKVAYPRDAVIAWLRVHTEILA